MASPVRFPGGVNNVTATADTYMLPMLDPTDVQLWFDDFNGYTAAEWTITSIDGGGDSGEVYAVQDAGGGVMLVTTNDADTDAESFEWAAGENFLLSSGKRAWLKTRLKVSDATDTTLQIGLHSTDTTPLDAQSRFVFLKADTAAAVVFNNDNNTTDSDSSTFATMADDTWIVLAAYWDGKGTIELFADGVKAGTMSGITVPSEALTVGFSITTGSAAAKSLSIDYIFVAVER